ncbi:hypothetical protein Ddye_004292 [Dipteronia dyeriana]|uniref:Metallothionein n=1 Tax=Dipteronia dyeriana TaxID=168575 RepID=A0AAD9XUJ1_9ROSI|nr:hypothetical protein Ddye_004292 [Dipteronia dyeriana]
MANVRGSCGVCNDRCGCPSPCPGGLACRCASMEGMSDYEHKKCSCGEHCGCNPCTCSKTEVTGTGTGTGGKVSCRCGDDCTCTTCAA